jgi:glyoxylase-like metal-dependent hydrolase (beta-lactamase superfamily II)
MYQVYALKYGERDTTACNFFFRETSHAPITLHFFVWLILGGPHPVLLDTGCRPDDARARELRDYVSPATLVERVGVKADAIQTALISHLHWDHWAGHTLFPAAQFVVQKDEVAFWTGPIARYEAYRMFAHAPGMGDARVREVSGEHEVFPGLKVHWVGGHTAGLQIVSVQTARGPVVLTSDASHFYRNVERYQPTQLITSLPQMLAGFDTIHALAGDPGRIVAGHDPEVGARFRTLEPGIIQIA